jgi:hypothetical protein
MKEGNGGSPDTGTAAPHNALEAVTSGEPLLGAEFLDSLRAPP